MAPTTLFRKSFSPFQKIKAELLLGALILGGLAAGSTEAACPHAVPVGIESRLGIPLLDDRLWDSTERARVEATLAERLVAETDAFPYWCFAPTVAPDRFVLVFEIVQDRLGVHLRVDLERNGLPMVLERQGQPLATALEARLWQIHQLEAASRLERLSHGEWVDFFHEAFRDRLLADGSVRSQLRRLLMQGVPVAETGDWWAENRETPSVVLPVPWHSRFQEVSISQFELNCLRSDDKADDFRAVGSPVPGQYPVASRTKTEAYEALQVFPEEDPVAAQLIECQPFRVLLSAIVFGNAARMRVANPGRTP